jgi:hypothetical protein
MVLTAGRAQFNMITVGSRLSIDPRGQRPETDGSGTETQAGAVPGHDAAAGFAWLTAWLGTFVFAIGSALLAFLVVTGEAGPYGAGALIALLVWSFGVAAFTPAAAMWAVHRLRYHRRPRFRTTAALTALAGAFVLLASLVANLLGRLDLPAESWPIPVVGVTLLALGAVLCADPADRQPALAFAAVWVFLLGMVAYRTWTDLRVEVVWFGPSIVDRTPGQVGFTATRSGDFEVRFGAHSCWDGQLISTGRYEWRPGDPGSTFGAITWVDLPADVLPIEDGDLVRVCVRDGLAAGTAAAESGGPGMGFWPRD